jgi:hypothetical protein
MVPTIHEWMVQWYWYVPGVVKVIVNDTPAAIFESLIEASWTPEGALVKVTVCKVLSLLTKVILVPAATLRVGGLKFSEVLAPVPVGMVTVEVGAVGEPIPESR